MISKLNLNPEIIDSARNSARNIAEDVQSFIDVHTTVSTERTVARLMGIDGIDEIEKPLPNVIVDNIGEGGGLRRGAAYWIGNAMLNTGDNPQTIAERISKGELDITRIPMASEEKIRDTVFLVARETVERIRKNYTIRATKRKIFKGIGRRNSALYICNSCYGKYI